MACSCSALSHGVLHRGLNEKERNVRRTRVSSPLVVCAAINKPAPRGFGHKETSTPAASVVRQGGESEEQRPKREAEDDTVPEIVTNRMLKRMAFTVGIPLGVGLLAFPVYYYLKMVLKLDVPEWLPVATSFLTFGTSGFGILYAVVSSSWDPQHEGSVLGWNEARANWNVVWEKRSDD